MKINHLLLKDFLGVKLIDVELAQPVQLFAGRNGSGKSSVRDAVALAITGTLPRIGVKKEAGELVRAGQAGSDCEVHTLTEGVAGATYSFGISAAGKLSQPKNLRPEFGLVVEAQRFASMEPDARRSFLLELMKVKMSPTDIIAELLQLGHDAKLVERIAPLLRGGFDGAAKDAKEKATAAKGEWRAITGETYGSEKAKTWQAAAPVPNAAEIKRLTTELTHCDSAIASWNEHKGKLKADIDYRKQRESLLPGMRAKASMEQRIRDKLLTDETELERLKPLLEQAQASAGVGARVGIVHDLAAAVGPLIKLAETFELQEEEQPILKNAQLQFANYVATHGTLGRSGTVDDVARAQRLREAVTVCESAIAHDQRDLNAALEAKAQIIHVEAELGAPIDADAIAAADAKITEFTANRKELQAALDTQNSVKRLADEAEGKTKKAADAHASVVAWDALGDALLPDGLPATLLGRALGPLNDRLKQSAQDSGWGLVFVNVDMTIAYGERMDYRLLSESEKWRVDAAIAEAISHLSGMKIIVLDRFDVLDQPARGDLLAWLDVLAENKEIDTALVFGTLKEPPKGLPESIGVHWIEYGVIA